MIYIGDTCSLQEEDVSKLMNGEMDDLTGHFILPDRSEHWFKNGEYHRPCHTARWRIPHKENSAGLPHTGYEAL